MIDFYKDAYTIFCQTPANPNIIDEDTKKPFQAYYGYKYIVRKCKKDVSYVVQNNKNVSRVYIKDIENYLPPHWNEGGYYAQPKQDREKYWTLAKGDFIVFDVVLDICENKTSAEFNAIKSKYALNGMVIENATPYISGRPTDHIEGASV